MSSSSSRQAYALAFRGGRRAAGAAALVLTLGFVVGGLCMPQLAFSQSRSVSLDSARAEHEAGKVILIDIREPDEHAMGIAAGARLLPMRRLHNRVAEIPADPAVPVLLICNTQNRSRAVVDALRERGYPHVRYVDGGMSEWARRSWPMVKPPP